MSELELLVIEVDATTATEMTALELIEQLAARITGLEAIAVGQASTIAGLTQLLADRRLQLEQRIADHGI